MINFIWRLILGFIMLISNSIILLVCCGILLVGIIYEMGGGDTEKIKIFQDAQKQLNHWTKYL